MSSNTGKVIILGGGPAGLAIAHACSEVKRPFVMIERWGDLGGLAQTVEWNGWGAHDLGPHKIFTIDKGLLARVKALLPADGWLVREKKSRIFLGGHYLPYPPSPFGLINVFGVSRFVGMVLDYGITRLKALVSHSEPATFEEDLVGRVGKQLYNVLFRPIAEKLWGKGSNLDSKLSKGRVQTPKLSEVLGRMLGLKKTSEFEALEFIYPKGGLQRIWDSIRKQGEGVGTFLTNAEVRSVLMEEADGGKTKRVSKIEYFERTTNRLESIVVGPDDFVFSTLPLKLTAGLMGSGVSAKTKQLIDEKVKLNDLLLVFLCIESQSLLPDSWVFVPDPEILFHRLSEQESFDPGMTPKGSIVCCEVMDNELRDTAKMKDEDLITRCVDGLKKMGFSNVVVQDKRVIRLPQSYPVFRPGYEEALNQVLGELDAFSNFRTVGRQGAFNYIGTLDALDIGYGAARWLLERASAGTPETKGAAWSIERERTRHFPVLD